MVTVPLVATCIQALGENEAAWAKASPTAMPASGAPNITPKVAPAAAAAPERRNARRETPW